MRYNSFLPNASMAFGFLISFSMFSLSGMQTDEGIRQLTVNTVIPKLCTIDSKIDALDFEECCITVNSKLDELAGDFRETWTALEAHNTTVCSKFDIVFNDLDIIELLLLNLTASEMDHFIATFTTLL